MNNLRQNFQLKTHIPKPLNASALARQSVQKERNILKNSETEVHAYDSVAHEVQLDNSG